MHVGPRTLLLVLAAVTLAACGSPSETTMTSEPSPSGAATAQASPTATAATPSPAATDDTPAAPADLDFHLTLFGTGQAQANALTSHGDQLIAVGVEYEGHLPIFGPTPAHQGRVWASADGRSWQDVTPRRTFDNVRLHTLIRRSDHSLVAYGTRSTVNQYGDLMPSGSGAWESPDGHSWTATSTGLPRDRWIRGAAQGKNGVLADVWQVGATHGSELWFSADGHSWEMVRRLADGRFGMDAGDEGFVVAGTIGPYGEPGTPFAIASADGREWFESADPPHDVGSVAAIEGDWLAISVPWDPGNQPSSFATWESPNGLDWSSGEQIRLDGRGVAADTGCWLIPSLESADRYVVVRSFWSGLCSEGGHLSYGPHALALDGRGWTELGRMGAGGDGLGAWVASAVFDGQLVLAGESNGQAAFWMGE